MRSPILGSVLVLSAALAATIGAFLLVRGIGQRPPLDALPADARLLVEIPDPSKLAAALARTRLGDGGDAGIDLAAQLVEAALLRSGIIVSPTHDEIDRLLASEIRLALVPGSGRGGEQAPALIVRLGHGSGTVLAAAVRKLEASGGSDLVWGTREHAGSKYLVIRSGTGARPLFVAGTRGLLLATSSGSVMRRLLDTLDGRIEPLRSSPILRGMTERLGPGGLLRIYAPGLRFDARLLSRIVTGVDADGGGPSPTASVKRLTELLGASSVRGAAASVQMHHGMFHERLLLAMAPDGRGLPGRLFSEPPRTLSGASVLPDRFPFYLDLSIARPKEVYEHLPELLSDVSGLPRAEIRSRLDGFKQFLAIDLDEDLFSAIGTEVAIGFGQHSRFPRMARSRRLQNTPAVASLSLSRPAAIRALLDRLDGLARVSGVYETGGDGDIVSYGYDWLAPMRPAYRLMRGRLLVATSSDLLSSVLPESDPRRTLLDRPGAARLLARLPERSHLIVWADTARLIDLAGPGLLSRDGVLLPLPSALASRLTEAGADPDLPPTTAAGQLFPEGFLLEVISPVSPTLLGALAAAEWRLADLPADVEHETAERD